MSVLTAYGLFSTHLLSCKKCVRAPSDPIEDDYVQDQQSPGSVGSQGAQSWIFCLHVQLGQIGLSWLIEDSEVLMIQGKVTDLRPAHKIYQPSGGSLRIGS